MFFWCSVFIYIWGRVNFTLTIGICESVMIPHQAQQLRHRSTSSHGHSDKELPFVLASMGLSSMTPLMEASDESAECHEEEQAGSPRNAPVLVSLHKTICEKGFVRKKRRVQNITAAVVLTVFSGMLLYRGARLLLGVLVLRNSLDANEGSCADSHELFNKTTVLNVSRVVEFFTEESGTSTVFPPMGVRDGGIVASLMRRVRLSSDYSSVNSGFMLTYVADAYVTGGEGRPDAVDCSGKTYQHCRFHVCSKYNANHGSIFPGIVLHQDPFVKLRVAGALYDPAPWRNPVAKFLKSKEWALDKLPEDWDLKAFEDAVTEACAGVDSEKQRLQSQMIEADDVLVPSRLCSMASRYPSKILHASLLAVSDDWHPCCYRGRIRERKSRAVAASSSPDGGVAVTIGSTLRQVSIRVSIA